MVILRERQAKELLRIRIQDSFFTPLMDPFRTGELYAKISRNEIPGVPADFKVPILETMENFGIEVVNNAKYWSNKHPVDLIDEINAAILETITTGKDFDETPLSPEELDRTKRLRIVFYHIRHVARGILRKQEEEGEKEKQGS